MRGCDSWKEAPSNQTEWLNGNKSQNPKKSLEEKQDFPKSLEPELNTEQPNFLLLIFSQPEKKTAFIEQHSKIFLYNIQKKKILNLQEIHDYLTLICQEKTLWYKHSIASSVQWPF